MLHPGVGDDDEEAGDPRAEKTMNAENQCMASNALFAVEEEAEESRLEEEAEDALHGERLADHASGELREARPVGAKFELHGNAGDDTEDELMPKMRAQNRAARSYISRFRCGSDGLEHHDQEARPMVSCGNR